MVRSTSLLCFLGVLIIARTNAIRDLSKQCTDFGKIKPMLNFAPEKFLGWWFSIDSGPECRAYYFEKTGISTAYNLYVQNCSNWNETRKGALQGEMKERYNNIGIYDFIKNYAVVEKNYIILSTDYAHYAAIWMCEQLIGDAGGGGIDYHILPLVRNLGDKESSFAEINEILKKNDLPAITNITRVPSLGTNNSDSPLTINSLCITIFFLIALLWHS